MNTPTLPDTIASEFARYFELFASRITAIGEGLTQEQFWSKPYPYGNSVGHLVLHLTGNLNYYIGAQLTGTGYVRDRDREFTDATHAPSAEVLQAMNEAVTMVVRTLASQTAEDWSREYAAVGVDDRTRFGIVLRCAQHFHHHLGQMIYLAKEHQRLA